VITGAHAMRVVIKKGFDPDLAVAEGVEYSKDGELFFVSAKKEVILSAGMFA
jgi:hypothetical protein